MSDQPDNPEQGAPNDGPPTQPTDLVTGPVDPVCPFCANYTDPDGNPTGGSYSSVGVSINWQNGPVTLHGRNGASLEDVIKAVLQRLEWLQESRFVCHQNFRAIEGLKRALYWLEHRTFERRSRGVEGTFNT